MINSITILVIILYNYTRCINYRYAFKNGTVSYQCRFLESNTYKQNKAAQRIVITEFGTRACPDPCKTIFHRYELPSLGINHTIKTLL